MELLTERVLAQLQPHELHAAWNGVLKEELTCVSSALDDMNAAMIKLVEVRNAVAQLEQNNGRTASLKTTMASTMGLNDKLAKQVEKIAVGVKTESVGFKRKANVVHEKAPVPPLKAEESDSLPASNSEAELDSDSSSDSQLESEDEDEIGGSEAALKALMKAQQEQTPSSKQELTPVRKEPVKDTIVVAVDNSKSAVTRIRLPAVHLKPIVQEVDDLPRKDRILITPDILLALKDSVLGDVDGRQRFEVISSLKFVVKWAGDPTEQVQCVAFYRAYAEAVTAYVNDRPVASEQTVEIDRLISELNSKLKWFSGGTKTTSSTGVSATRINNLTDPCHTLKQRVHLIDEMPFSEHRQQLLGLLISFKAETSVPWTRTRNNRVHRAATIVSRWTRDAPREPDLLCFYALLVDVIRQLAMEEEFLVFLTDRMIELIAETPSFRAQDFLMRIKDRAAKFLKGIEQHDTCSTVTEIKGRLDSFRAIVNHVTLGWVSREDPTVQKCVKVLKGHIKKLQRHADRDQYYQLLATYRKDPSIKTPTYQVGQSKPKRKKAKKKASKVKVKMPASQPKAKKKKKRKVTKINAKK